MAQTSWTLSMHSVQLIPGYIGRRQDFVDTINALRSTDSWVYRRQM